MHIKSVHVCAPAAVFVTDGGSQEEEEAGRCFTDREEEEQEWYPPVPHLSAPGRDKVGREEVGGGGILSEVGRIFLHWEPFNGALKTKSTLWKRSFPPGGKKKFKTLCAFHSNFSANLPTPEPPFNGSGAIFVLMRGGGRGVGRYIVMNLSLGCTTQTHTARTLRHTQGDRELDKRQPSLISFLLLFWRDRQAGVGGGAGGGG